MKVKAAGGISSFDDAEKFMSLGADRLGTSRLVKIMKNTDNGAGSLHLLCASLQNPSGLISAREHSWDAL